MMYKHPKVLKKLNINLIVMHVTQNLHKNFNLMTIGALQLLQHLITLKSGLVGIVFNTSANFNLLQGLS